MSKSNLVSEPGKLTENFLGLAGFSVYGLNAPFLEGLIKVNSKLPIAILNKAQEFYLNRFEQWAENKSLTTDYLGYQIQRTPGFRFLTNEEAKSFEFWLKGQNDVINSIIKGKSNFLKFLTFNSLVVGSLVYVFLNFDTGDAAGQNMATLGTQRLLNWISEQSPIKPINSYIDPNASGDKKPASLTQIMGRGGSCSISLNNPNFNAREWNKLEQFRNQRFYHNYWVSESYLSSIAGLLLALGQDLACLTESEGMKGSILINKVSNQVSAVFNQQVWGIVGGGTRLSDSRKNITGLLGEGAESKSGLIQVISGFSFLLSLFDALDLAED